VGVGEAVREAVPVGEGEGLEEGEDPREELGVAVGVEVGEAHDALRATLLEESTKKSTPLPG